MSVADRNEDSMDVGDYTWLPAHITQDLGGGVVEVQVQGQSTYLNVEADQTLKSADGIDDITGVVSGPTG